jgi:hypothetical protein
MCKSRLRSLRSDVQPLTSSSCICRTYQMPMTPTLFTEMTMGNESNNARVYGSMTNALMLDHLAMIQVTIVNT